MSRKTWRHFAAPLLLTVLLVQSLGVPSAQASQAHLAESITAAEPADDGAIRLDSVTGFDPEGGSAVIDPGTDSSETVYYSTTDSGSDELVGVSRPSPLDHASGALVEAAEDPEPTPSPTPTESPSPEPSESEPTPTPSETTADEPAPEPSPTGEIQIDEPVDPEPSPSGGDEEPAPEPEPEPAVEILACDYYGLIIERVQPTVGDLEFPACPYPADVKMGANVPTVQDIINFVFGFLSDNLGRCATDPLYCVGVVPPCPDLMTCLDPNSGPIGGLVTAAPAVGVGHPLIVPLGAPGDTALCSSTLQIESLGYNKDRGTPLIQIWGDAHIQSNCSENFMRWLGVSVRIYHHSPAGCCGSHEDGATDVGPAPGYYQGHPRLNHSVLPWYHILSVMEWKFHFDWRYGPGVYDDATGSYSHCYAAAFLLPIVDAPCTQ